MFCWSTLIQFPWYHCRKHYPTSKHQAHGHTSAACTMLAIIVGFCSLMTLLGSLRADQGRRLSCFLPGCSSYCRHNWSQLKSLLCFRLAAVGIAQFITVQYCMLLVCGLRNIKLWALHAAVLLSRSRISSGIWANTLPHLPARLCSTKQRKVDMWSNLM